MTFAEVLEKIQELLPLEQRVSYRGLKRRFDLDDEYLKISRKNSLAPSGSQQTKMGDFWSGRALRQLQIPRFRFQVPNPSPNTHPLDPRPTEGERSHAAGALQKGAKLPLGQEFDKIIPDSIGLIRQCNGIAWAASCLWHTDLTPCLHVNEKPLQSLVKKNETYPHTQNRRIT